MSDDELFEKSLVKVTLFLPEEVGRGLFSPYRITNEFLPNGYHYKYDIRGDDDGIGELVSIKNGTVMVNHEGTFFTKWPISNNKWDEIEIEDYNYEQM